LGSENEFVDIDSFSDPAPEVQKEVIPDVAAGPPVAAADFAVDFAVPQPFHPHEEASPEFVKELELTVYRGEDPIEDAPLLEIREKLPEGQAPSPSQAAFNKSFGTSYRGELLSVGCRAAGVGGGGSEILTLWKSPTLVDETGEGVSEKTSRQAVRGSGKKPCTSSKRTSTSSGQMLLTKDKKGSLLFTILFTLHISTFFLWFYFATFQSLRIFSNRFLHPNLSRNEEIPRQKLPYLEELHVNA
jgi:hypothetical protein